MFGRLLRPVGFQRCPALVLLLLSILGGVCGQYSIKVHLSSVTSIERGQLNVTCDVTNRQKKKSFFILWIKKTNGEEVEIGTNEHVNELFSRTGRYSARYHLPVHNDYSKVVFYLTVTNLTSADSGDIGCRIPDYVEILRPFTVIVPVTSVRLMSRDLDNTHAIVYEDAQSVTFAEGQRSKFTCHVNGSHPAPEVKVTVGSRDVTGSFGVTKELVREGPRGLQASYYKTVLVSQGFEMEYEFSGQTMTCTARDPDHVLPARSASIYIHLSGYRPKFLCSNQLTVRLYQSNVTVSCRIVSDPPLLKTRVTWRRLTGDRNETLKPGQKEGQYGFALLHLDGTTAFEQVAVLTIGKAYPQVFRAYTFEADNELGTSAHQINLMEPGSAHPLQSGSSRINQVFMLPSLTLMTIVLPVLFFPV